MEWGENILCLQFVQAYWLVASYLSHSQSFPYLLNFQIPVILLMANLCSFSFRYLYTQWWLGQGGNCSFRGQWGETLEVAFGGKLLGVDEIRSSWYGQHWWSSRWCYHCCSLLEAGIWSEHYLFFLLDMSCSVTCFDCNPCFSGSLSSLSEFLPLFNICSVFIFNFYKPWRKGREGEVRGGVLGNWGSRVSCCSYFDLLLSKVLFNCSCYGFLKLLSCDFAVCWWEGSMDAYWLSRPSLEWEETCCNRIWHFYFGRVGFEELFLDKDWSILLGSHTHQGRRGGTMSQSILDGVSNHMNKYVGGVK